MIETEDYWLEVRAGDVDRVAKAFLAICNAIGAKDKTLVQSAWQQIVQSYTEPHRHYHTLRHIADMLHALDAAGLDQLSPEQQLRLNIFAVFHDIVYVTDDQGLYRENEGRSAEMADTILRSLMPTGTIIPQLEGAKRLILASQTHVISVKEDPLGAMSLDIDMSILGAEAPHYQAYAAGIRQEFAFEDSVFYPARRDFLKAAIDKPLFLTLPMREKFEMQARFNMRREIQDIDTRLSHAPRGP